LPWLWGTDTGRYWTLNGLILIVIACPCALTISTPVTYAAGLAATAQRGIVCKGGASLEALGSVKTVVLDKTGTITEGKFAVTAMEVIGDSRTRQEMLALLALMEAPSSHPLSATLVQAAKREGVSIPKDAELKEHSILPGEGVTATVDGKRVYVGNQRLFERIGMYEELSLESKNQAESWGTERGGTVGFMGIEMEGIVGSFCVTDVVRAEAKETIEALLLAGIHVLMLTGDGKGAAKAVARQVGLPDSAVHSQLLPEDKMHFITSLKSPTLRNSFGLFREQPKVLFCGDGVNDAPALASADIGISMGEGAALAMEMSDVTLMDSNLSKLLYVIHMGSKVLRTIRENILLSLLCKLAVVALTFGGYMTLLYAIASDVGVMLLVTLNGMKLLPRSDEAISLDQKGSSRFHAWKSYTGLPTTAGPTSPTNVAELDGEIT
jgi:Zn2+/Cd2+-exporting ATPase